MATRYSPRIVTDGLVFCYDFANSRCWDGTGSVTDLAAGREGTPTNGPTFSRTWPAAGGSIFLDGGNDYVKTDYSVTSAGSYTFINWIKLDSRSDWDMVFGQQVTIEYGIGDDAEHNDLVFYSGNGSTWNSRVTWTDAAPTIGEWTHCAVVSTQGNVKFYKNGTLHSSTSDNGVTGGNSYEMYFGIRGEDLSWNYLHGSLASCLIYNKELSATEVSKNYIATKGRFGL